MKRSIKKVAVLGSGVMGSRIACHFANIGIEVLLLDIVPRDISEKEKAKGLDLEHPMVRNRIVNDSLQFALKSNPSPIYSKKFVSRISTGNFDDDISKISEADWIIEVVIERLDIKKQVFENVEKHRKPGTLITTNTSGIPIHMLIEGRSEDFQKHFCGTHFFNPPRYLKLLEIIPSPKTDPELIDWLMGFGSKFIGKTTVLCKDTPAFIANRIGVYSIQALLHLVKEMRLTVEQVDKLTGPVMGRPKSATFRTADVVGLDTMVHVANGVRENCPEDEENATFIIPDYLQKMVDQGWLGSKSGQGFYKKTKNAEGKTEILSLDLNTLEYKPQEKVRYATLGLAKDIDNLKKRTEVLFSGQDVAGEFYRKIFSGMFKYVSNRVPEVADEIFKIDDALKAGFGYEMGPFETWDVIGVEKGTEVMKGLGMEPAAWVNDMIASGNKTFFQLKDGIKFYYDQLSKTYKEIPGQRDLIILDNIPDEKVVWKNSGCKIKDLGDGIINLEWNTKMNTIGGEVIEGINKAIDLAEAEYRGLIISNTGQNFSAGANVGMIFMMAAEQELDELEIAIRTFQNTVMRIRYSSIPVIVCPHNMALGGACEMTMHADKVVAHAESYIGMVEFGVGVIPGGAGTKEFTLRASDDFDSGDIRLNTLRERFLTIGQAKVSTSAHEAYELGILREGIDEVVVSREHQLAYAKEAAITIADKGYQQPVMRKDITVLGQEGLGIIYVGAHSMKSAHYISDHDQLISEKLGTVMCGGDLSQPTQVSEKYILDLERKAFLELCMERKTMERMQSLVTTGKILRN